MPLPHGEGYWNYEDLLDLKKFIESYGLVLEAIENLPPFHWDKVLYGMEGRDEQIAKISRTIRNMGKAKINCLGYCFSIVGYWGYWRKGDDGGGRGGAGLISFDYDIARKSKILPLGQLWSNWETSYYDKSKTLGKISRDEMWERLVYFLQRVIPVAEELTPDTILYIPGRWAHRSINTGEGEDLVTIFTYPANAGHDYATIETKGFRKLLVDDNGKPVIVDNPKWGTASQPNFSK